MKLSYINTYTEVFLSAIALFIVVGCGGGGSSSVLSANTTSKTFIVSLKNVAPTESGTSIGTILDGMSHQFSFDAVDGQKLTFVSMLIESNDLFIGPDDTGLDLFPSGVALDGDITSSIKLWDAGTEVNETPGSGPNQGPRQAAGNTGVDENGNVKLVANSGDGFTYPAITDLITVTITPVAGVSSTTFTVTITNISAGTSLETPFASVFYVLHPASYPLFRTGTPERGNGIEKMAEDGSVSGLTTWAGAVTTYAHLISPGVYAVHSSGKPVFSIGSVDAGEGLESLAEDGSPSTLAAMLSGKTIVSASGVFDTPFGDASAGVAASSKEYRIMFSASTGDRLSLASMFVQSNDLFFSPNDTGIELFPSGTALSGDISSSIFLWDAGTELNETPGSGANQAPRQGAVNTGTTETEVVRLATSAGDGFVYPEVTDVIRVSISSL